MGELTLDFWIYVVMFGFILFMTVDELVCLRHEYHRTFSTVATILFLAILDVLLGVRLAVYMAS